jgi:hypothetical protein
MTRRPQSNRRSPRAPKTEPSSSTLAVGFRWPSLAELLDPRAPFLLPALLVVLTRVALSFYIPFAAEDAYITFRFARNFANGFGLVFNPNERVFGFSSPLWTVWMGLGLKLGASPVSWARLTTLALELATLVVVTAMLRRGISHRAAWCFAFFWAGWPFFSAASVSGMENQAMVGLIALSAAWIAAKSPLAGPSIALVALTRPEGLVSAAILAWRARARDRWIALALVAAGIAALTAYFGSPIPESLIAKSKVYGTPGPWAGRHWWDWLSPFVMGRYPRVSDTGHLFLLTVVFAPAAFLGVRALWKERAQPVASFAAACLVVWMGYAALGIAYFWWYLAVPLAGLATLAAVGFPRLAAGRALDVSVALLIAGLWTVVPNLYLGRAQNESAGFAGVANYLSTYARPGQTVFLEPIGMVGFGAPVRIIDEVGLVSPQVAARRVQGPGWYSDVVARERPDWLVTRRGVLKGARAFAGAGAPFRDLAERDALLSRYQVETEVDTVSGDNALLILRRRP